jgi:AbiV family abortive infection protein
MGIDMHEEYQQLYRVANNNATDLLAEAKVLLGVGAYARAFFLAFTALEEISKSQLAADVVTGFISEDEFLDHYRCHPKKIGRLVWATEEARRYLDIDLQHPDISSRVNALYASLKDKKVQTPADTITKEDAQGIIHTVEVALDSITTNDFMGYPIGSKGFM